MPFPSSWDLLRIGRGLVECMRGIIVVRGETPEGKGRVQVCWGLEGTPREVEEGLQGLKKVRSSYISCSGF